MLSSTYANHRNGLKPSFWTKETIRSTCWTNLILMLRLRLRLPIRMPSCRWWRIENRNHLTTQKRVHRMSIQMPKNTAKRCASRKSQLPTIQSTKYSALAPQRTVSAAKIDVGNPASQKLQMSAMKCFTVPTISKTAPNVSKHLNASTKIVATCLIKIRRAKPPTQASRSGHCSTKLRKVSYCWVAKKPKNDSRYPIAMFPSSPIKSTATKIILLCKAPNTPSSSKSNCRATEAHFRSVPSPADQKRLRSSSDAAWSKTRMKTIVPSSPTRSPSSKKADLTTISKRRARNLLRRLNNRLR